MIVTIDGPAGAGKSTVARELARRLGFRFLDTGAMYRAVALAAIQRQIEPTDSPACERLARQLDIRLDGDQVFVDGQDCTVALRQQQVTSATRHVAAHAGVRARLVELQREAAIGHNLVTEGRDQGTVAFPDAECKFFLTADPDERARRRQRDLRRRGQDVPIEQVLAEQQDRDQRDESRPVGPLRPAPDAIRVDTTRFTPEQVVDLLERYVRERMEPKP